MTIPTTYEYAKCDGCDCVLNQENGCNSYWYADNIITVCDNCSLDISR